MLTRTETRKALEKVVIMEARFALLKTEKWGMLNHIQVKMNPNGG